MGGRTGGHRRYPLDRGPQCPGDVDPGPLGLGRDHTVTTAQASRTAQFGRHRGRFGLNLFRIRAVADPVGGVQPASRAVIRRR